MTDEASRLRSAAAEVVAAFDARPDTDERNHPNGLTHDEVERAWAEWDLRQLNALDSLRAALGSEEVSGVWVHPNLGVASIRNEDLIDLDRDE